MSLLAFTPRTLNAQVSSPPSPTNISSLAQTLVDSSTTLELRLKERKTESTEQSDTLGRLSQDLKNSQADSVATSNSLAQSELQRKNLQTAFDNYKDKSADDLAAVEKERDAALTVARLDGLYLKIGAVVTAALAGYIGGHAAGWWK
jgi:hypothetical protein